MFRYNLFLLLLFAFQSIQITYSQGNLIINGSFEAYTTCPDDISQADYCTDWSIPTRGTSDYFNNCTSTEGVSVPINQFGNLNAFDGNAYMGTFAYSDSYDINGQPVTYIEYLQGKTSIPLEQGKPYKMSLELSSVHFNSSTIDEYAAYFSSAPFFDSTTEQLNLNPQCVFHKSDFLTTVGAWMHVETTFIAQGGENYFTLGTFSQPGTMNHLMIHVNGPYLCYLYIDDVKLVEIPVEPTDPQTTETFLIPNIFTPNGDGTNDLWKPKLQGFETQTVSILNRWGNLIYESSASDFSWNGETLSGEPYCDGIYFYRINGTDIAGSFELVR